jgi:hypothetical protein
VISGTDPRARNHRLKFRLRFNKEVSARAESEARKRGNPGPPGSSASGFPLNLSPNSTRSHAGHRVPAFSLAGFYWKVLLAHSRDFLARLRLLRSIGPPKHHRFRPRSSSCPERKLSFRPVVTDRGQSHTVCADLSHFYPALTGAIHCARKLRHSCVLWPCWRRRWAAGARRLDLRAGIPGSWEFRYRSRPAGRTCAWVTHRPLVRWWPALPTKTSLGK